MLTEIAQSIEDVVSLLKRHAAVTRVDDPIQVSKSSYQIIIEVAVELPSRAKASGRSATGVLAREQVIFEFGEWWPSSAPSIGLRKDFPRNLPHINPYKQGDYIRPCVFAGSLTELMHREGFDSLVDQTVDWLSKAAANNLISVAQGWEPTRREGTCGSVVFDADQMVSLLQSDSEIIQLPSFFRVINEYKHFIVEINPDNNSPCSHQSREHNDEAGVWTEGRTRTFVAAPPFDEVSQTFPIYGDYQPEEVSGFEDLIARAIHFGIDGEKLRSALNTFINDSQRKGFSPPGGFYMAVILAVQRPLPLISSYGRSVELLPYVIRHRPLPGQKSLKYALVEPALHQQSVSPKVLRDVSGTSLDATNYPLIWLGVGSVGSKVALHLVKAGFGNNLFVDNDMLSPHNMARHGLVESPDSIFIPMKSYLMKRAAVALGHSQSRAMFEDAVVWLNSSEMFQEHLFGKSLIIDATASLQVLNAACSSEPLTQFDGRYARTALLGGGKLCYLALEGEGRASRIDDLMALLYARCITDIRLRQKINEGTREVDDLFVGQNCSSATTIMADSVISRGATSVAVQLQRWLESGFPATGILALGVEDEVGIGLSWVTASVGVTEVLQTEGGWEVRVLREVADAIELDAKSWGGDETGGALLGHVYFGRRCIVIGGLVEAPSDSERTPIRFKLGVEGLEEALRQAHADSLGHLHFVGTWHSHPNGGIHSAIDLRTLGNLAAGAQGLPAVSLVWTPAGFICEVRTIV